MRGNPAPHHPRPSELGVGGEDSRGKKEWWWIRERGRRKEGGGVWGEKREEKGQFPYLAPFPSTTPPAPSPSFSPFPFPFPALFLPASSLPPSLLHSPSSSLNSPSPPQDATAHADTHGRRAGTGRLHVGLTRVQKWLHTLHHARKGSFKQASQARRTCGRRSTPWSGTTSSSVSERMTRGGTTRERDDSEKTYYDYETNDSGRDNASGTTQREMTPKEPTLRKPTRRWTALGIQEKGMIRLWGTAREREREREREWV